jgi:hypothetical protein
MMLCIVTAPLYGENAATMMKNIVRAMVRKKLSDNFIWNDVLNRNSSDLRRSSSCNDEKHIVTMALPDRNE